MKKLVSVVATVAILSVASFAFAASIKGPVSKINKNADGSYTVTVKDNTSGKEVVLQVSDDQTVAKFNTKKIVADDEVRVKYDEKDGKNISSKLLKAAGC